MRKVVIVSFLILVVACAGIYLIEKDRMDLDVTAHTTKVGVLMRGTCLDESYGQAHFNALESLRGELNLEMVYREKIPADCYKEIVNLIRDEGCKIIVGAAFDYSPDMELAAETYPEVCFLLVGGTTVRKNLSSFFGRMYQARYLSGIVAGMQTQTGEIGYVAAFPVPEVIRGINAFTLGVRSVRPDAVVRVRYCDSWTDDEPAGKACRELMDRYPIDVVTLHTNSLQPHREADVRGIWSIGYNVDNTHLFPDTYLTACVWKWEGYYKKEILSCLQGKFRGSSEWTNMDEGAVALSTPTTHVPLETRAILQEAEDRFKDKTFDVFYGPISDNTGRVRVAAGESMSDNEMLKNFNWYVEGVRIEGKGMGGS